MEASFIIFRLKPYHDNFGKRIVKSPKLYFTDVGLAAYLLGINEVDQISRDPLLGYLIYAGDLEYKKSEISVLNFANTYSIFQ